MDQALHPAPSRPRQAAALWIVLAGFAAAFAVGLALRLAGMSSDLAMLLPPIAALTAWFLVARRPWRELGLPRSRPGPGWRWGLVAYALAAAYALAVLLILVPGGLADAPMDASRILQAALMVVLVAGVATGLAEEVAIRGVLLTLLRERIGAVLAIAASAVLFAIMHIPNMLGWGLEPLGMLSALLGLAAVGGALGYLVVRTGSLWMAIGWHAGANGAGVGGSALTGVGRRDADPLVDLLATLGEAVAILLLAELVHRRRSRRVQS